MSNNLKTYSIVFVVTLLILEVGAVVQAKPTDGLKPGTDFNGPHFNLIMHGVPAGVPMDVEQDASSHSMFVPLDGDYQIFYKMMGEAWSMPDRYAIDDGRAEIYLPTKFWFDPDGVPDSGDEYSKDVASYRVYLAAGGKPTYFDGKVMIIDSDASLLDPLEGDAVYVDLGDSLTVTRAKGKPKWQDATGLFMADVWYWSDLNLDGNWYLDDSWDGTLADTDPGEITVVPNEYIFDVSNLENYWWSVDNAGIKQVQVRFYPVFK